MTAIKVGFVLLSNSRSPLPSTRISALNMFGHLREAHFDPQIAYEPANETETPDIEGLAPRLVSEGYRIVFFQKVHGPSVELLARQLTAAGVKTVFGVCDLIQTAMVDATDATVAVTAYLKSLYPPSLRAKIHIVHDGIEDLDSHKSEWGEHHGSPRLPLRAVLVTSSALTRLPLIGSPPPWLNVTVVGRYPPRADYLRRLREVRWRVASQQTAERLDYLNFIVNRRIQRTPWDPVKVYEELLRADIGIIPVELPIDPATGMPPPEWLVKSENRLTLKMSAGLPVVATPIPSYEAVIEHGVNGFLARSNRDWLECLDALRDPVLRRDIGMRARESVHERFSTRRQAERLIGVLNSVLDLAPPVRTIDPAGAASAFERPGSARPLA